MKIGTHDSVTGERGKGIISFLVTPFSKTQSKTIDEQIEHGCTWFDIRARKKKDKWICAHGLWKCKTDIEDIFSKINAINGCARITYEGWDEQDFLNKVEEWHIKYPNIKLETINVKYPGWRVLKVYNHIPCQDKFIHLDFSSWHTLLPIPWLWKKIYYNKVEFNNEIYTVVDFL